MHFDVVHVGIAVTFSYFLRGSFRDTGVVFGVYGHSPREKKIYQNHSKSKLIPLNWCFLTSKSLMSYSSSGCRLCSRLVSCQASSYDLTSWKRIKGFDLFSLKSAKTSHFQKTYQAKTYQAPRNGGAAGCRTSFQLHPALLVRSLILDQVIWQANKTPSKFLSFIAVSLLKRSILSRFCARIERSCPYNPRISPTELNSPF